MRLPMLTVLTWLGAGCFYSPTGSAVMATSGDMATSTGGAQVTTTLSTGGSTTSTSTGPDPTTGAVEATLASTTATSTTTGTHGTTDGTTASGGSTTDGGASSSSSEATGPPDTTGAASCDEMVIKEIVLVDDAEVTAPMEKVLSMLGEGMVARSEVAEQGTVTFSVELACEGTFALWGRVLDHLPGIQQNDADSFHVQVDDGPESFWFYGCQTAELSSGYSWQRLQSGDQGASCEDAEDVTPTLSAGIHSVRLRNREAMNGSSVAAIARLLITTDLLYMPMLPD